jgi:peptidyl-tRNA hydrolase
MGDGYGTNVMMKTKSLNHLLRAKREAEEAGLFTALIEEDMYPIPGTKTITALGIGPAIKNQVYVITKRFNLL